MSREYRHIKEYEKEILELKGKGLPQKQIGERLGFSKKKYIISSLVTMKSNVK